jgi:hypothetical protein
MPEVDLIAYLVGWYADGVETAAARGAKLTLSQSPPDRPKPAAWVTASRGDDEAQVIVWASGESEFAAGTPGRPTANEHHELTTTDDLDRLLARLLESVGAL